MRDRYETIRAFMMSPLAFVISFLWGLFESTVFFVVPDVFLGLAALFSPVYGLRHCACSILGAAAGGSIMFGLAHRMPQPMLEFLVKVPGISGTMVARVGEGYQAHGLKTIFMAPWNGVPYKIFAVQAGAQGVNFFAFLAATIPARLERFISVVLIAILAGAIFRKRVHTHPTRWIIGYSLFWVSCYALYVFSLARQS